MNLELSTKTHIMGVLNATPDSFSDGGRFNALEKAVEHALSMEADGADIIDIGGESTRPGSERIPLEEELSRTIPIIEALKNRVKTPISIDTNKAKVAKAALEAGAYIVNDISGMTFDKEMVHIVKDFDAPIVIMHTADDPAVMQKTFSYADVVEDIFRYFEQRLEYALKNGVKQEKVVLDPGIGFGKSVAHNIRLIREAQTFKKLGCPVLIGASRKSFIGAILDLPIEQRLEGSLAALAISIVSGADILRVHDVLESVRMAKMVDVLSGKLAYES